MDEFKKSVQWVIPLDIPLIVIVGPTASGKSATAMRIAEEFSGEIICSDSRTIYKGMDIGTAKPSVEDQKRVPHWGIDLIEPGESFTAADFKQYAIQKIAEIRSRMHVPILVGGTGLYVDGVVFDYNFVDPQPEIREKFEKMTLEELQEYCANNNVKLPENQQNRRYIIRTLERQNIIGKKLMTPLPNTIIVGITTERDELRSRIETRADQLFAAGMIEEAINLGQKYGWDSEAMTGNIYKLVKRHIDGELNMDELKQRFIYADWQLAKRQLTWLKRNPYIIWKPLHDAYEYLRNRLALGQ